MLGVVLSTISPLDYLKDTFSVVRPYSVSEDKNENILFHCKPAKGDQFEKCFFKTPSDKVWVIKKWRSQIIDYK